MPVSRHNPTRRSRWMALVGRSKTLTLRGQMVAGSLVRKGVAKTFTEAKRMLLLASRKRKRTSPRPAMGGR